jgi:uncharacterized protein (DUF1697 family)
MYIAFLRAINVGGRNVRMQMLKTIFESVNLERIETFISSGNLIFESNEPPEALEIQIETALEKALGYEVKTFIRTLAEVAVIASFKPFSDSSIEQAQTFNVGFLKKPITQESLAKLQELKTGFDEFHSDKLELYWLSQQKQSDSKLNNAAFEKRLGVRLTFRGMNTIQKLNARPGRNGF